MLKCNTVIFTDVLEEHAASIFRVEVYCKLKMEAMRSTKMSLNMYQIAWYHIPEDTNQYFFHIVWGWSCCMEMQYLVLICHYIVPLYL
jgi:hypothetical protein